MSPYYGVMVGILVFTALLYLSVTMVLVRLLRIFHEEAWVELGKPSLLNWSIGNSFRLLNYVFLSGKYKDLHDVRVGALILLIRILLVIVLFELILAKIMQTDPSIFVYRG